MRHVWSVRWDTLRSHPEMVDVIHITQTKRLKCVAYLVWGIAIAQQSTRGPNLADVGTHERNRLRWPLRAVANGNG